MEKLIQWWLTPRFPRKHIENILSYRPTGLGVVRNFYRTWLVHPFKRRAAKIYLAVLRGLFGLKVIGITGSAGKTTTKEMLASILKTSGRVVYSYANIDPVYNIPATILRCSPATRYLVLEMGIEFPGEMDFYLWMASPDIGVITNINATHTEFLGSLEGVAREKGKLVKSLGIDQTAVLNSSDKIIKRSLGKLDCRIIWYGEGADVYASGVNQTADFETRFILNYKKDKKNVQIPFLGKHFVQDALAASTAALALGLNLEKVEKGLRNVEKPAHRMNWIVSPKGYNLIDDAYNANPLAVKETLETFKSIKTPGRKLFVFGEMKELGDLAVKSHKDVGRSVAGSKIDFLFCIGTLTKHTIDEAVKSGFARNRTFYADSNQNLVKEVKNVIKKGDVVLIKGSRSMKLEEVVESLK